MGEDEHTVYEGCPHCAKDSAGNHENGCPNQHPPSFVPTAQFGYPIMGQIGWVCPHCNRSINPNYPTCIYCDPGNSVTVTSDTPLPSEDAPEITYHRWGTTYDLRELLPDIKKNMAWMIRAIDIGNTQSDMVVVDSPEMKEAKEVLGNVIDEIYSWKE